MADDSPAMHVFEKQGFEKVEQTDGSLDDAAPSPTGSLSARLRPQGACSARDCPSDLARGDMETTKCDGCVPDRGLRARHLADVDKTCPAARKPDRPGWTPKRRGRRLRPRQ